MNCNTTHYRANSSSVPGDPTLGYDGRPWRELVRELLDAELPMRIAYWGSSPDAFEHSTMMSAAANWHLFDTVDVLRRDTGAVEHHPTAALVPMQLGPICSEQLAVAGVRKPLDTRANAVSWGIVDGTRIGYVYVWSWADEVRAPFAEAIRQLTQQQATDGVIVDFRYNVGGGIFPSGEGFKLLFDHPVPSFRWMVRVDPTDHLKLNPGAAPGHYLVGGPAEDKWYGESRASDHAAYDRPIAMLTGPGAVSAGDMNAFQLALHPRARVFGKATNTAFTAVHPIDVGDPDWLAWVPVAALVGVSTQHDFLTHVGFPVGEPVWLRPDDVAVGKDTVVQAAIEWIRAQVR